MESVREGRHPVLDQLGFGVEVATDLFETDDTVVERKEMFLKVVDATTKLHQLGGGGFQELSDDHPDPGFKLEGGEHFAR